MEEKCMEYSYERALEAIKIANKKMPETTFHPKMISFHIFSDCHSAILATTFQNRENYHNSTVRPIQENLMDILPRVQNVRLVCCPAHQCIEENETADSFAKIPLKKARHLQPNTQLSLSEMQQGNFMLFISKLTRR